jgi:hypothetical protein
MAIDYRGLRSLTARELIAALNRDGFYFVRQVGSHQRYAHIDDRAPGELDRGRPGKSQALPRQFLMSASRASQFRFTIRSDAQPERHCRPSENAVWSILWKKILNGNDTSSLGQKAPEGRRLGGEAI